MLQSLFSLLPGGRGGDRPRRSRRGGRTQAPEQTGEHLGKWIWLPDAEAANVPYVQARKVFELDAKPETADLKVAVEGRYQLYVNGVYVGQGCVPGGHGLVYFDTHDIAGVLEKGRNVVAFLVHASSTNGRKPGIICKAEIAAGGQSTVVESEESWRMRAAAEWVDSEDGSVVFDARSFPLDWMDAKCREREWRDAAVVGVSGDAPWGELTPRLIPALAETVVAPEAVVGPFNSPPLGSDFQLTPLKTGAVNGADLLVSGDEPTEIKTPRGDQGVALVLDFGRMVSGEVEIGVAGSGRGVVTLTYLDRFENGHAPVRSANPSDRLILDRGRLIWRAFSPRSFRFLLIEFRECTRPVVIDYIHVKEIGYPLQLLGRFECNDRLINDIWKLGIDTTALCMRDTFVDSPSDVGMSWSAARIASRVAYYAFNDSALLAQSLRQIASDQGDDGSISGLYPIAERELVPDAALFWVFSIVECFAFSGDAELARELYPRVSRLMDWFSRYIGEDGLLSNVPGRIHIDDADIERRGSLTALNCLCYQALQVTALIAGITGWEEDAQRYMDAASALKLAINKHLYVPKRGLYAESRLHGKLVEKFSRQANVLAVLFDIPDHYRKATIYRLLASQMLPEIETPYFASHYLEALYSGERHDEALTYMRRKWGPMAKSGDGTTWELFTGEGRLAHASSVCPTRDLVAEYVGIKPIPGSHRYAVAPHTGDLDWAEGSLTTPMGLLEVGWRKTRNSITINVMVPEGIRVDIYPPCPPDARVTVDGKQWPSRFASLGEGEHMLRATVTRPAKEQAGEEPEEHVEAPHVEIMGGMTPLGRRRLSTRDGRPRTRGGRRERGDERARPVVAEEPVAEVEEVAAPAETPEAASETQEPKSRRPRRRSRRSPRRRNEAESPETPVDETKHEEPQAPAPPVEAAEPAEAGSPAEPAARPRPRRRRSRAKQPAQLEQEPVAAGEQPAQHEPQQAQAEQPVQAEQQSEQGEGEAEQKPRRRRRSYRRRRPAQQPPTEEPTS